MRPQVKTTLLISGLGLSLAMNVAFTIGALRRADAAAPRDAASRTTPPFCLLERLQLDSGQRARLAKMRQRLQVKRSAFWRRSAAIKANLADAICAPHTRPERLESLLARYAHEQSEMQRSVTDHLRQVGAMLRPDQRDTFHALLRTEMFHGLRKAPASTERRP